MFTMEQIKAAHAKVESGADFPRYFENLKALGITWYETFVADGHTVYHGTDGHETTAPPRYTALAIADVSNPQQFEADLRAHQQGKTDFPTFCTQCATLGVAKWIVRMELRTCTYYDRYHNMVLTEGIPAADH
jgi:uncharacterized protein YbcV (DUF1398 family)